MQVDDTLLNYHGELSHPEFECYRNCPVHLAEAKGETEEIEVEMGTGSGQEKPQDSPVYSTEAKSGRVGMGTGTGIDEELQRIASRLHASASK